jgi:hypothetical protein
MGTPKGASPAMHITASENPSPWPPDTPLQETNRRRYFYNICRVGHVALKSVNPQARKFFVVVPQRKLRLSKAQLRSLRFKILDATVIATFMT